MDTESGRAVCLSDIITPLKITRGKYDKRRERIKTDLSWGGISDEREIVSTTHDAGGGMK
jgi:hypothetical protein